MPPPCCKPEGGETGLRLFDWEVSLSVDELELLLLRLFGPELALLEFADSSLAREDGCMGDADFLDALSPFPPLLELRGDTRPVWGWGY